jgi:hypothetical protein
MPTMDWHIIHASEYPFRNYNLFVYVYVLSFYNQAKKDKRFLEALEILKSKMVDGQIVVERIVPKLLVFHSVKRDKQVSWQQCGFMKF